jgi:ABC-type antimicrobial peptide transport system permease subunit
MLRHYILLALRHVAKNRLFFSINILGMAIAIACCTVAYYLYDFNATFDAHHVRGESVYRISSIRTFQNEQSKYAHVPLGLGSALEDSREDIGEIARYSTGTITTRANDLTFSEPIAYTDPSFFDLFTFAELHGSIALADKSSILVSDELAVKYFGNTDAVGEEIVQILSGGRMRSFTVRGVFRKPTNNSSFTVQAYTHFDNQVDTDPAFDEHSWEPRVLTYVSIPDKTRVQTVEKGLQKFTEPNNLAREDFQIDRYILEPLPGLAKQDSYGNTRGMLTNSAAHISAVAGTGVMGILILLIACFNLTNTAIAVSSGRLKEIGLRKVMGSGRGNVMAQYMGEVFLVCLLALLLGLFIADRALIPAFNSLWAFWSFTPDYFGKPDYLIFLLVVLGVTSLLAGSYPAFHISRFQPVQILKGKVKFGGTNVFTRVLLTFQLIITLIAVVCSLAFVANAGYQQTLDMGFAQNEVVFTEVDGSSEYEALKNVLARHSEVLSVASSHHHIGASYLNDPVRSGNSEYEVDILDVGDEYLSTTGITLLEGRDFVTNSATDKLQSVIVTENMVRAFGWTQPLGQELVWMDTARYQVIGVVKNIVNKGMMSRMHPVMLRYKGNEDVRFCLVSASSDKIGTVKSLVESEAHNLFPDRLTTVRYMNELVANSLEINSNILKMFVFLGIIATLLSATGLYSLTSLSVIKRMKEIGVRKVLGASDTNIALIVNKQFFIILGLASVFGGYFGASLSSLLLDSIWEHFQRTTFLTVTFSISTLLVISGLSIAYKIFATVRMNPTTVLRSE